MVNAIVTINRDEGPLAFWKGVEAVFMRNTICMLGMVYGYKEVSCAISMRCSAWELLLLCTDQDSSYFRIHFFFSSVFVSWSALR